MESPNQHNQQPSDNISAAIVRRDSSGQFTAEIIKLQTLTITEIKEELIVEKDPCAICYETLQLPIVLPCDHEFCYLCLKTTLIFGNYKCPTCRCVVPDNFLEKAIAAKSTSTFIVNDGVKWMYSGRHSGWWFYENAHNQFIEEAYQKLKNLGHK